MQHGKPYFTISPVACIGLALATVLIPLNWLIAWLAAVIVHEACHLLVTRICGAEIYRIHFRLSGAIISAETMSTGQQIVCALAGPTGGLLLLLVTKWAPLLAVCGCVQSIFNLMPLRNRDGGKVLQCILLYRLDEQRAHKVCAAVDRVMRFFLCAVGLIIAWKLSWLALAVACIITLLCRTNAKTPCKHALQKVQ